MTLQENADQAPFVNFRDLGGLTAPGGRHVRPETFYRSEVPLFGDLPPALEWPPRTVVDLRSEGERNGVLAPMQWSQATSINVIPLMADADPTRIAGRHLSFVTADYLHMFQRVVEDRARELARAITLIAHAEYPVLVHCSAGKDRTGILVALALDLIGVSTNSIVRDFLRSNSAAGEITTKVFRALGREPHDPVPNSAAELLQVISTWRAHRGGVEGWLVDHGARPHVPALLRERLLRYP
ncbi:MAG: tyrosine-protein phosphatase [Rhodococcus sp. (in: high G+C Gram-positive bacteria)]|uniref:tyrosine-protein phosphatase n=1 Tax=Rhodococcus sp. TaxID=1831 RepID=UPI0011F479DB|nr:tyrosine-protein phosphatase [Rhodococcus sp. (in: high G+C Gram-positive bacteria)]RZL24934.1 MAG: tyrosine-protein phosphatase [Rhodococcus sp. (in: high G+C Gram-positive bacteria)]